MKHTFLSIAVSFLFLTGYAQLPKWLIDPAYDNIAVMVDKLVIAADSLDSTVLWDFKGNRLFKTSHKIHDFNDGYAVVVDREGKNMRGFVDLSGNYIPVTPTPLAFDPEFQDGYVTIKANDYYGYISKYGERTMLEYCFRAWPIHKGLAPIMYFKQPEKRKDPSFCFYSPGDLAINYTVKEKPIFGDIMFLSGVNQEGKAIAVIKNKLYWFSVESLDFTPMMSNDGMSDKLYHVSLDDDYSIYFANLPQNDVNFRAKIGKKGWAYFSFDDHLRPDSIVFNGVAHVIAPQEKPKMDYESNLAVYGKQDKRGLKYKGEDFLPRQFDEVGLLFGNCAFVKSNGKWGVLEIDDDLSLKLSINKGDDIPFRHQKFVTQIRLDLPPEISSKEARIEIPESSGCSIDKTSREKKDTESGNYVQYECTLTIPDSLPDVITDISYPVTISYDGIQLFDMEQNVRAWHYKYYNVDPIDSETSISNGVATFTVNINADRFAGENAFPFDLRIEADSISATYEKLSETRYKCTVSNLQEGENLINIYVIEKGCPPSVFPFELTYVKPVPRKKTQESVVIRKKTPAVEQKKNIPRLEI